MKFKSDKEFVEKWNSLDTHSKEWFAQAFEDTEVPEAVKKAAEHIVRAYNIRGIADPAYIANVIQSYLREAA